MPIIVYDPKAEHWWRNVDLRCESCGCIFKLTEEDKVESTVTDLVYLNCPKCTNSVRVYRSINGVKVLPL
jgi:hypothetical protein